MTIKDVFTASAAARAWELHPRTVLSACTGQKGIPPRLNDNECQKSGGTWLVTRQGMERLYGPEKK